MKVSIFALTFILLVAALCVQDSEAGWRGRRFFRRIGRAIGRVARIACPFVCRNYCKYPGICSPVCGKVCGRRKRDLFMEDSKPFPAEFHKYDQDNDGRISLSEFAKTIDSDERLSSPAFDLADINEDGHINDAEFASAPFSTSNQFSDDFEDDSGIDDDALVDME